jgi:MOSC domain-containing protein YiiM
MKVISVNVGKPKTVMIDGKPLTTGIYKEPVLGPLSVTTLNFAGDGQADLVHHGGRDKAICAYPSEHFKYYDCFY